MPVIVSSQSSPVQETRILAFDAREAIGSSMREITLFRLESEDMDVRINADLTAEQLLGHCTARHRGQEIATPMV